VADRVTRSEQRLVDPTATPDEGRLDLIPASRCPPVSTTTLTVDSSCEGVVFVVGEIVDQHLVNR
jgi:hypothetical protein